jgi:hypothetical protein
VRHYASVDLKHLDLLMREIDHNLAADKAHLGRTKMTRWGDSADECRELDFG